jgi:hypothetical protein
MVKIALLLLTALSLNAEYRVDMISAYKRTIQDKVEKGKTVTTESRASDNIVAVHGNFSGAKSNFEYKINFILNKRFNDKDYKDILYLGENCYLLLPVKKLQFVLGRKLFSSSPYQTNNWKDGLEGFGIETQVTSQFRFHVYLVDFYRGYPLFEKFFFYKNISDNVQNGERFRHGLSLVYHKDSLYSKFQFTYLNLGNWGNGTKDDLKSQPRGDSDFIYNGIFSLSHKGKYFTSGFEFQFARGLDKTQSNTARKEKSIPVSGELIRLYFESYWKFFQTRMEFFIPDSDKKNWQGEVLESGFVGVGSYPGNAFLLNQELNYYPSGWVTPSGLQKVDSVYNGRRNSFWTHLLFSARLEDIFFILQGDHMTPRKVSGASTGNISLDKNDYEKSFLFELTGSIRYDRRNMDGFYIQLNVSKLYTSKDILLDGTSAFLQGGVLF